MPIAPRIRPCASRWLLVLLAAWLLAACGSLPTDVQRPVSHALPTPEATLLGQLATQRRPAPARAADSGLALIDSANMAFASRLALTRAAQRTLDIQYYAIHADASTRELLRAVRDAAARGVRVRILLDDFNTTGRDALVMAMAFVPGVEMRMYNPLPGGRGAGVLRAIGSLHDFRRMQHRMHNKLYIADNSWGITGGRNLGDAYFGTADGSNFIDMDVLAVGPVVRAMSASFDQYWNNPLAYPVASLTTPDQLRTLRGTLSGPPPATGTSDAPPDTDSASPAPPPLPLPEAMNLRTQPLIWAPAELLVDEPSKLIPELNDEHTEDTVIHGMLSLMQQAQRDVLIVSPYFVPGEQMMQVFADTLRRGVRVRALTNSLASNDAPLAHVGYARYRRELIRMGVQLHEMRALQGAQLDRTVFGSGPGGSKASLHAKMLVIDGQVISIGSMNFDLRSKLQNTEVALVVRSRALSAQAATQIEQAIAAGAWQMELTENDQLRWRAPPGAPFDDAQGEPDASWGLQLMLKILGPFAPDEML
ncbi:MAG: phospholipase D family protein [Pseudomonadota bacterium]|nr:phospholipase D family protein [Pseudomonadota bacterium]